MAEVGAEYGYCKCFVNRDGPPVKPEPRPWPAAPSRPSPGHCQPRRRREGAAGARAAAPGPAKGLWLYGRHAVEAALANPRRSCHRLLATAEALARLGDRTRRPGLEVETVERAALERLLGDGAVHQGLALAVAPLPTVALERACAPAPGRNLVLVLDQINDPHNLGAILRSAVAFGARAVVCRSARSGELGGAAAKAASGALDLIPVVEVVNLARALDELAALGYWRLALDAEADGDASTPCPKSTTSRWCSAPRAAAFAAWSPSTATSPPACRPRPPWPA